MQNIHITEYILRVKFFFVFLRVARSQESYTANFLAIKNKTQESISRAIEVSFQILLLASPDLI